MVSRSVVARGVLLVIASFLGLAWAVRSRVERGPSDEDLAVPAKDSDEDKRLELVLSEALRALTHQQALLDNIRSRATVLTASAALIASLLGSFGRKSVATGTPELVVLVGLGGVLCTTLGICLPWWKWRFRSSASSLLQAVDIGHSLASMRRHLAVDFEKWLDRNDRTMRKLQWLFLIGILSMAVEVTGWMLRIV